MATYTPKLSLADTDDERDVSRNRHSFIQAYIDKPDRYYGTEDENPYTWLRNLDLIKTGARLEDMDIIIIAATKLKGTAASWWDMENKNVKTWDEFKNKFEEFFVSDQTTDAWWNELETVKQGTRTVAQLQLHLEELFTRLSLTDNNMKKRYLLKSLEPSLAYEVERARTTSFLSTIQEAKRIESLKSKYVTGNGQQKAPTYISAQVNDNNSMVAPSLVNSIDQLDQLAQNLQAMKIHLVQNQQVVASNQQPPPPPNPYYQQPRPQYQARPQNYYQPSNVYPHQRQQQNQYSHQQNNEGREKRSEVRCYTCNQLGHIKWHCPSGPPSNHGQNYYQPPPNVQQQYYYQQPQQQPSQHEQNISNQSNVQQQSTNNNTDSGKGQGQ
jgi:hypothetical protein